MAVSIMRIDQQHPLYAQEVELRERELLSPIGLTMQGLEELFPGFEERFEHFVAVIPHPKGDRVVGVVCLVPDCPEKGVGKLMQMVVDRQLRKEGIGRLLLVEFERRALGELKLQEVFCHARDDARGFYEALGWEAVGKPFDEAGVKHYRMVFRQDGTAA